MNIRISPRLASILTLSLIAILGTFLLFQVVSHNIDANTPASTQWRKAVLFGINTALLGILVWRMTPSLTAGLVIAALFITNKELLQAHVSAVSDPLFIFLSLLSFWAFDLYFERPPSKVGKGVAGEWWWLIITGLFAGMAYLIHYAGLALIVTFAVALLVLRTTWRKRFISAGIFLTGILPLAFPWTLRDRLVSANATPDRALAWHPMAWEKFNLGIVEVVIFLVLIVIFLWVLRQTWIYMTRSPRFPQGHQGDREAREVISYTTGIFIITSFIYTVFFDPASFDIRSFSPMIIGIFILIVAFGTWLRNKSRMLVIIATVLILAFSIYKQAITITEWSKDGNTQLRNEFVYVLKP